MTNHTYTVRAIYAFMLAIMFASALYFTFWEIRDTRDYRLAKQEQEYCQAQPDFCN